MQNYHKLIDDMLKGNTPKEKYDHLVKVKNLLHAITNPKRGTEEESWDIMDVVGFINVNDLNLNDEEDL